MTRVGHEAFSLACAHHIAGRDEQAIESCRAAKKQFEVQYAEAPVREWARDGAKKAGEYLRALEVGTADTLHQEWKAYTIKQLGIESLLQTGA